jgi:hypothetical protein
MMNYNDTNSSSGKQDGVAAQCKDGGLPITNKAFIEDQPSTPELEAIKNFKEAHFSKNYWWVFKSITDEKDKGYVKKRN